MGNIAKVIKAEFYKHSRGKPFRFLPVITVLASVLIFLGVSAATETFSFGITAGFYISAACIGWIVKMAAFAAVVITSFQISNEFSMGTVKSAWVQPLSRRSWYIGKLLYTFMLASAMLILSILVILVLAAIKYDFASLVENEYMMHSETDLWLKLGLTALLAIWVLGAIISSVSAVSLVFNAPGSTIAVVIAVSLVMLMLEVFSSSRSLLLSSYITIPADQFALMAKGLPLPVSWQEVVKSTMGFTGGYLVISLSAGFAILTRKEIKS